MPLVRVYVPLARVDVVALQANSQLGPAPIAAHTALAATARPGIGNDDEDREYAAWLAAADAALDGLVAGGRRVVASADVDSTAVRRGDDSLTAVELAAVVPLSRIASFHIDETPGGEVADLLWYDVTELDQVLALLDSNDL